MKRRRLLVPSPLDWRMTPAPVPHPALPVLAERGGTQLRTPRPVALVDTREKNPFDFSRFEDWFADVQRRRSNWVTIPLLDSSNSAWSSGKTCPISSVLLRPIALRLSGVFNG